MDKVNALNKAWDEFKRSTDSYPLVVYSDTWQQCAKCYMKGWMNREGYRDRATGIAVNSYINDMRRNV